tara:strand:+ start:3824 stop:4894 length:1071 start_codon:yes stop_codon:yes gene_type:complete
MKKLKVALCFSGQARTWEYCLPTWKKFMAQFEIEPDVFIHTWDFVTDQNRISSQKMNESQEVKRKADPHYVFKKEIQPSSKCDSVNEYISALNPKKYKIDNKTKSTKVFDDCTNKINKYDKRKHENPEHVFEEWVHPNGQKIHSAAWMGPQFYSMMYCSFLKQEYEIENNIQYDLVFKFRSDLLMSDFIINHITNSNIIPSVIPDDVVYTVAGGYSPYPAAGFGRVGDIFFGASSRVYDMVCGFYRNIPYMCYEVFTGQNLPPEIFFSYFIKSLKLSIVDIIWMVDPDIKVVREDEYFSNLKKYNIPQLTVDAKMEGKSPYEYLENFSNDAMIELAKKQYYKNNTLMKNPDKKNLI